MLGTETVPGFGFVSATLLLKGFDDVGKSRLQPKTQSLIVKKSDVSCGKGEGDTRELDPKLISHLPT